MGFNSAFKGLMWVFLFLPLFTFFTAGRHKVSTKPYLVLCCYFHVLPVGHFVRKTVAQRSELRISGFTHALCLLRMLVLARCSIFSWRIISECLLYFCTEFYIAYIFLKFRIATLFFIPPYTKIVCACFV